MGKDWRSLFLLTLGWSCPAAKQSYRHFLSPLSLPHSKNMGAQNKKKKKKRMLMSWEKNSLIEEGKTKQQSRALDLPLFYIFIWMLLLTAGTEKAVHISIEIKIYQGDYFTSHLDQKSTMTVSSTASSKCGK